MKAAVILTLRQLHMFMLAVFCMAFVAGWIYCNTTVAVRAWKYAAATYEAERDYYKQKTDAIVAEADTKILKEKKHVTAE